MLDSLCLLAQAAGGAAPAGGGAADAGPMGGLQFPLLMCIMFFFAYFILIRPAQNQEKARKLAIMKGLKKGDDVTFAGGILGTVVSIKEKTAGTPSDNDEITVKTLESKLRILRSSIYTIVPGSESETKDAASA
jgi:preprotein translocase subunit YajC